MLIVRAWEVTTRAREWAASKPLAHDFDLLAKYRLLRLLYCCLVLA